jgi:hypothetical protein
MWADVGILRATDPDRAAKHYMMPDGDDVEFRFQTTSGGKAAH